MQTERRRSLTFGSNMLYQLLRLCNIETDVTNVRWQRPRIRVTWLRTHDSPFIIRDPCDVSQETIPPSLKLEYCQSFLYDHVGYGYSFSDFNIECKKPSHVHWQGRWMNAMMTVLKTLVVSFLTSTCPDSPFSINYNITTRGGNKDA